MAELVSFAISCEGAADRQASRGARITNIDVAGKVNSNESKKFRRLSVLIEWHARHSCRNAKCQLSHLLVRLSGSETQNWFTPGSSRNSHNDHVFHGVSMVTEVIDSCSQAGAVPQAMGDHGPTPCRRPKEKVDVPVDQVLQAQVVQKTVEIPARRQIE